MEAVWLALIVAVGAASTTLLTTWLNARAIRAGKAQDYARQDAVAAQAAVAAQLLERRQDAIAAQAAEAAALLAARQDAAEAKAAEAAMLLLAANERVAAQSREAAEVTTGKLNQIHELVNSTLTGQMEDAHAALTQQIVLTREVIALHMAAGRAPSADALEAIAVIEGKAAELGAKLADRARATQIADARVPHANTTDAGSAADHERAPGPGSGAARPRWPG